MSDQNVRLRATLTVEYDPTKWADYPDADTEKIAKLERTDLSYAELAEIAQAAERAGDHVSLIVEVVSAGGDSTP